MERPESTLKSLLALLLVLSSVRAEGNDGVSWMQTLSGLGPFLIASFFLIFSLNVLLYPPLATRALMQSYQDDGLRIQGQVLSCETKAGSGGDKFIAEIVYEVSEHKYADNPSMKFRFPGAYVHKKLMRRFEYDRELARGETVEILLPPGPNGTRSGCPTEVVEKIKGGYSHTRTMMILVPGLILLGVSVAMSVWEVLRMENSAMGWMVLAASLGVSELLAFLYCADQFFKAKRVRFDSARPMVTHAQQVEAAKAREQTREELLDPYAVPMHEFAGHARASQRVA